MEENCKVHPNIQSIWDNCLSIEKITQKSVELKIRINFTYKKPLNMKKGIRLKKRL